MNIELIQLIENYVKESIKYEKLRTKKGFEKKVKIENIVFNKNSKDDIYYKLKDIVDVTFGQHRSNDDIIKNIILKYVR